MKRIGLFLMMLLPCVASAAINLSCAPDNVDSTSDLSCVLSAPAVCSQMEAHLILPDGFKVKEVHTYNKFNYKKNGDLYYFDGVDNESGDKVALFTISTPKISDDTKYTIKIDKIFYKFYYSDEMFSTHENLTSEINLIAFKEPTTTTTTTTTAALNYVLTLDSNGGDIPAQTLSCTPSGGTCDISLDNVSIPNKEGYKFTGWGSESDCTSGTVSGKINLKGANNLYACWTVKELVESTSNLLKDVKIDGYDLKFDSALFQYELNVSMDVDYLSVKPQVLDNKYNVVVSGNNNLVEGNNTITIKVIKDGTYTNYYINVLKGNSNNEEVTNPNEGLPKLKYLEIKGYTIPFHENLNSYNLDLKRSDSILDISASVKDENTTYEIIGNQDLKDNSIVSIVVKDENGTRNTYSIVIHKNFFDAVTISILACSLVLVIVLVCCIISSIKKNKKKKMTNNKKNNQSGKKRIHVNEKTELLEVLDL